METKIIKVVFGGRRYTTTAKRTRTDYGQMFEFVDITLPETFEVIFSNSSTSAGTGKKMIGSNQRCPIPDEYLKTGQPIYAWVLVHDGEDDGRHMYSIKSPVDDMPDTSPEEPTPVEQSVISQAITALNTAVDTTTQKAQEATESADRAEQAAEGVEGYAERAENAQQAAENARDRATQAETSARTSAATATEKASEAISSATTASQSALTAESASESAQEYASASAESALGASRFAVDAGNWAYNASESAQTASTKASEASQKATEASQKASEAAQSASTAVQAKTDAETAKQASETAQGLAEQARNEAVTAKTGAESARDEAQEIVDGITNKMAQIDSNTNRIESLEENRYKPYPTDTVSGSIASFADGADDIPLKSCIVHVEPVQAGSGDPSPDNVRPITGWTGCEVQRTGENLFGGEAFRDAVLAAVSTATTGEDENGRYVTITASSASNEKVLFEYPWKENTVYTFVYRYKKNNTNGMTNLSIRYKDGTYNYLSKNGGVEVDTVYTEVVKSAKYKLLSDLCAIWASGTATIYYDDFGVFEGDISIDDFVPYKGRTYPITFPSEAGTVYGAYVDVVNGELVVDRAIIELRGQWRAGSFEVGDNTVRAYYSSSLFTPIILPNNKNNVINIYADKLQVFVPDYIVRNDVMGISENKNLFSNGFWVRVDKSLLSEATQQGIADWLAQNPIIVCYKVKDPIHYPLTPTEIKTLLGQNNIWADCGDTEVEYRADVKLYINKKIAEAISALS